MSEAIETALIQGAVKALTPEAETALREIHEIATSEFVKLDDAFPALLQTAETDTRGALRTAEGHLAAVVNAIRGKLGIPALGEPIPAPVDPTPAVPAPQTTQS